LILIAVENWGREFEAKYILAKNLALSKKTLVIIIPKRVLNAVMHHMKKSVFLHKSFDESMNPRFYKKNSNNNRLYMLEEESLHRTIPYSELRFLNEKYVDAAFSTTLSDHEDLSVRYGKKAIFSGHPRFNCYSSAFKLTSDIKNIGKYYLFSSNFSMLFPTNPKMLDAIIKDNNFSNTQEIQLRSYIKAHTKRARIVLDKIKTFSHKRKIVYRPHPLEDPEKAKQFFKDSNVIVNGDYSIYPWISGCELLLHSNCTSAVEANLMGKKTIAIDPLMEEFTDLPIQSSSKILFSGKTLQHKSRKKLTSLDLINIFWGSSIPYSNEIIVSNINVPEVKFLENIYNIFFIVINLLRFHLSQFKTIKEYTRFSETEINRVLKSNSKYQKNLIIKKFFEAIIFLPNK
jgi:surface carbohydrate biosynthesis protein